MKSFRKLIHGHISRPTLFVLIGLSLTGLTLLSQSFLLSTEATLANFEANLVTAPLHASISSGLVLGDQSVAIIPPPSLEIPNQTLTLGDSGNDIILLQEFLRWRGFWPTGEEITGYFGEVTQDAVIAYQIFNMIEAEGIVGPITRDFWLSDLITFKPIEN